VMTSKRKVVGEVTEKVEPLALAIEALVSAMLMHGKRPTNPALAVHCRAWEVCSVIGKLVSTHDDGYGFGWPGASAEMDDL
jgi:hypothetical protein